MTQLSTPTRTTPTTRFEVYTRLSSGDPGAGGVMESATGGDAGWAIDNRLAFERADYRAWPGSNITWLRYVPVDGELDPFEYVLNQGLTDDHVRVVMYPRFADTSLAPSLDDGQGLLIFDGFLQKTAFGAQGAESAPGTSGGNENEGGQLIAVDAPTMDNRRPEHLVMGRWVNSHPTGGTTPVLIDGLSVPSVFNAKGKPNRGDVFAVEADAGDLSNVNASLFTADADPRAGYWTVKEAIAHLVVFWLFGIKDTYEGDAQGALPRSATLEPDTYDTLFGPTPEDPRFVGLDNVLSEVNVHGLGVYDAIERVCRAAGFRCAISLPMGRPSVEGAAVDRLHQLRIWRAGSGRPNTLRLVNRFATVPGATAEQELSDNNLVRISGVRDALDVTNQVTVAGRTLVEVSVELKPLFRPSDMDDLGGEAISQRQQVRPTGQQGDTYHQKHVAGGRDFNEYRHVGRMWGLDETGIFDAEGLGYTEGDYAHGDGSGSGFDWLAELSIDGTDELSLARAANGVTGPIRSMRRARKALKLTRPDLAKRGQAFILEVSEDAGATWHELPASAARLLTDEYFGIMLTAANLASVNRKNGGKASENTIAVPDESWWALMAAGTALRFRLTCLVEMDQAARFDAPIVPSSQSVIPRAVRIDTGITEVWQSATSILGGGPSGGAWARLDDGGIIASTVGADRTNEFKQIAERARDELSQVQWSVTIDEGIRLDPSMFQVGDRINGVEGRNVDFDNFSAGSGTTTYPSVVGVTLTGLPEDNQRMIVDIGSDAMRRGA